MMNIKRAHTNETARFKFVDETMWLIHVYLSVSNSGTPATRIHTVGIISHVSHYFILFSIKYISLRK